MLKITNPDGEFNGTDNNYNSSEHTNNGSLALVRSLEDTQTKWDSDPVFNKVACYTQDTGSLPMVCRKFEPTFYHVFFDPANCTKEFQADKEYECRRDEESGWVPAKSPEDSCQFPVNVS